METLNPWDELLCSAGKNAEDVGRMLRGKGRKKPRAWTIKELEDLSNSLKNIAETLDVRINFLKEGLGS